MCVVLGPDTERTRAQPTGCYDTIGLGLQVAAAPQAAAAARPGRLRREPGSRSILEIAARPGPRALIALPMSAGLFTTVTPAASSAAIFSAAVPLPPEMIAPAWPMRRPGGAVWPAMKPTTGFLKCALIHRRGVLFGAAADLADHDHRLGLRVGREQLQRVDEGGADERVAADADARRLAEAELRELVDRLVGQRAALRHDADAARLQM